jgi:predicted Zn-dependent protease
MKNFILYIAVFIFIIISTQALHLHSKSLIHSNRARIFDLYISNRFDDEEVKLIEASALEWENKTHHIITYHIYYNFDVSKYKQINTNMHSIIFVKLSKYSQQVNDMDRYQGHGRTQILGLYDSTKEIPVIFIVYDRMLGQAYYQGTIMHELGHSLGLDHIQMEDTLMYPTMDHSSRHISSRDLQEFCKIYNCDYKKLN